MTVTFNSVQLADGDSRTVRVAAGLAPAGELNMEVLEYLRAAWAVPVARGNRVVVIPMVIQMPPCEEFGAAMMQSLMYFANLPDEGPLEIAHRGYVISCAQAVCGRVKQEGDLDGLSNDIALQFTCGQLTAAVYLVDETGDILLDEDGNPFTEDF